MSPAQLCAVHLSGADVEWQKAVSAAAERLNCSATIRRNSIDAWQPDRSQRIADGVTLVDGWRAAKLWLGTKYGAVGILAQRIYLRPDGSRDSRPEHEIVGDRVSPKTPLETRLQELLWFLNGLKTNCPDDFGEQVSLRVDDDGLLDGVMLRGRRDAFPADTPLRTVHERGGFLRVPDELEMIICRDEGVDSRPADDYADRAKREFEKRGVKAKIRPRDLRKLEERLRELDGGDAVKRRDVPILFMLARQESPPTDRLRRVMHDLERHDLPWRRAYATDDRTWSVAEQAASLLQAAGGHSHEVVLPAGARLPWSIGIDVSRRDKTARVAAALINPEGRLVGAWTADQPRQENIDSRVLGRLLGAAANAVPAGKRADGILVVRDGRVFESECADDYRRDLGGPVTLVELRKSNNPSLLLGKNSKLPVEPMTGWFKAAVGGSLAFLVTLPRAEEGAFGSPLKLWMRRDWDGIRLGPEGVTRVLFAQTLTPGLGLQRRRLPAPVYWADGIAGASDKDLRFRGLPVVREPQP